MLGVVHRDVKMENFLLDFDEVNGEVIIQLTDFGLAAYATDTESLK